MKTLHFFHFAILVIFVGQALVAMQQEATLFQVNGKQMRIEAGKMLTYETTQNATNICLEFNDNDIKIGSADVSDVRQIRDYQSRLEENLELLSSTKAEKILGFDIRRTIKAKNAYFFAGQSTFLKAGQNIKVKNALFKSPQVTFITGTSIKLQNCFFLGTSTVKIVANIENKALSDEALILVVAINFKKDSSVPLFIAGHVDFENNRTVERLTALGAEKVSILIGPANKLKFTAHEIPQMTQAEKETSPGRRSSSSSDDSEELPEVIRSASKPDDAEMLRRHLEALSVKEQKSDHSEEEDDMPPKMQPN